MATKPPKGGDGKTPTTSQQQRDNKATASGRPYDPDRVHVDNPFRGTGSDE